jgi:hypothetical protein
MWQVAMPWRCPVCRTEIQHLPSEPRPDPRARYRCDVCRLNLRFNVRVQMLIVTESDEPDRDSV